ncbi:MAG: site-specific DNA-methyltransferase [Thermoproteota archaeon]|nr:site-specific DNA-methyltransferase [Thermoproteota archaeon]
MVDVIVTSPPYNINKEYGYYRDKKGNEEYLDWILEIARLSSLVLKDDGSFFLNVGGTPSDPLMPYKVCNKFLQAGYILQNTIHWIKSISIEKKDIGRNNWLKNDTDTVSIGHFKPIVSKRYLTDLHEYIFHFTKHGNSKLDKLAIGVPYQDKTNIGRWKSATQDKRDRGNVWFISYPTTQEKKAHPATFPEKLPYLCIKLHGVSENSLIYDPFMGIGSTALACLDLGVNYIGTEIDADYIRIAKELIKERKRNQMLI